MYTHLNMFFKTKDFTHSALLFSYLILPKNLHFDGVA